MPKGGKMKKVLVGALLLVLVGCSSLEQNARDSAAALNGALVAAQTQYQTSCSATPTASPCTLINRAVDAQNALITATEAYCGWTAGVLPADPAASCKPVSTATAGLQAAVNNANSFVVQLKGVIQ